MNMKDTTIENENNNSTIEKNNTNVHRKRRLSKKERKTLKKKQKTDEKAKTSSSNNTCDNTTSKSSIIEVNRTNNHETSDDGNAVIEKIQKEGEMMKSYKSIKVPMKPSAEILSSKGGSKSGNQFDNDDEGGGGGGGERKLGAWFPNALLVKCKFGYTNTGKLLSYGASKDETIKPSKNPKSSLLLFYQYTGEKKWTQDQVKLLMTYMATIGKDRNLGGRIRVAQEGVNATLSAVDMPYENGLSSCEILRHAAQDLKNFDPNVFTSQTDFKYIDGLSADRHFKELKIIPVQELVYYGIREEDASCREGGIHLDAKEYHEMLKKENTVVVDVRNHYETILGRFDGQQSKEANEVKSDDTKQDDDIKNTHGAEYIDPRMRKSTDFTTWLSKEATKEKLKKKSVLMFCTGGIRCERASAYLKKEMGDNVDGVYQLQGGVERYLEAFPDGGFWRGSNFVFDKREAVSANAKDGCGGVIRKSKKGKGEDKSSDDSSSKCCVCGRKWDRYVGKKKCYTCGVPVLMCDKCMSLKPDKKADMMLKVRCPLCVEENITIPASKVEFTDNGVKSKIGLLHEKQNNTGFENTGDGDNSQNEQCQRAASSVCKWGGGHAKQKKFERKMKQTLCRFGSECVRKNCYFFHPDRTNS